MSQRKYYQNCGVEISPTTKYRPSRGAVQQAPAQSQQQPYVAAQPQPPPPPQVAANKSTGNILAGVSIIIGIVGLFVAGIILGIVAMIVGAAAISRKAKAGGAVGIILGIIDLVASLLLILEVITV